MDEQLTPHENRFELDDNAGGRGTHVAVGERVDPVRLTPAGGERCGRFGGRGERAACATVASATVATVANPCRSDGCEARAHLEGGG